MPVGPGGPGPRGNRQASVTSGKATGVALMARSVSSLAGARVAAAEITLLPIVIAAMVSG